MTTPSSPTPPDSLMQSTAQVELTDTPDKLVVFPTGEPPVAMGMHDDLAAFYGADPQDIDAHASTLDYVVGALGACLAGTFKRALAARDIHVAPPDLRTTVVGDIVVDDDVPVIHAVEVRYELSGTREEDRDTIERAHAVHERACAVSRSLEAAIGISTTLILAPEDAVFEEA